MERDSAENNIWACTCRFGAAICLEEYVRKAMSVYVANAVHEAM